MKDSLDTIAKDKFAKALGASEGVLIGALHFPPLPGYPGYPGFEAARLAALADLAAFKAGGMHAIVIENNYDVPHTATITPEAEEAMVALGHAVTKEAGGMPIGVSVLWNDFAAAFRIAKAIGGKFIRVPVFVDKVRTSYDEMTGDPTAVLLARSKAEANDVLIFADIHVKHAEILSGTTIEQAALAAIEAGADALIVTGRWTGEAAAMQDLKAVRDASGTMPIVCGSGVDAANAKEMFSIANGAIVSTSLKEGEAKAGEVNVKGWEQRISTDKVRALVEAAK